MVSPLLNRQVCVLIKDFSATLRVTHVYHVPLNRHLGVLVAGFSVTLHVTHVCRRVRHLLVSQMG